MAVEDMDGPEDESATIPIHLRPLLGFSNLINVNLCFPFNLHDLSVRSMAVAWPRIRSLVLDGWGTGHPSTSILALVPLARHCPELQTLTIFFDARSLLPSLPKLLGVANHSLKKLDVLKSPIGKPEEVAAFLYDIFPEVGVESSWGERSREQWEEVDNLMRVFGVYGK